jgi:hypothetical protein
VGSGCLVRHLRIGKVLRYDRMIERGDEGARITLALHLAKNLLPDRPIGLVHRIVQIE